MPDMNGLFLVAGSWAPILAVIMNASGMAVIMSTIVSALAGVDYLMKIWFKLSERRHARRAQRDKPKCDCDEADDK